MLDRTPDIFYITILNNQEKKPVLYWQVKYLKN